jgi:peptide/nickel transport system permease protein
MTTPGDATTFADPVPVHGRKSSDLWLSFRASRGAQIGAAVLALLLALALFAPLLSRTDPYDLATADLLDSRLPPAWATGGDPRFLLGTDNQGADLLSMILYGMRASILVGALAVMVSASLGTVLGLAAGYVGGRLDGAIMRVADIQFTFPAILLALLIGGLAGTLMSEATRAALAMPTVVLALGVSHWPHFARLVRASTLVEKTKDYVTAARMVSRGPLSIMFGHILPNVLNPIFVLATLDIAFAIMGEATLSFLGFGLPITQPSLGSLIRVGYGYLFSGEWWVVIIPSLTLVVLVVAINLVGDWLRDALDPKLR